MMTNKRYEFDNRKPSAMSRIGSTVIAVGSVATAISIAMPSVGAFVVQETAAVGSAFGLAATPAADQTPSSSSAPSQTTAGAPAQATNATIVSVPSVTSQSVAAGSPTGAASDADSTSAAASWV